MTHTIQIRAVKEGLEKKRKKNEGNLFGDVHGNFSYLHYRNNFVRKKSHKAQGGEQSIKLNFNVLTST